MQHFQTSFFYDLRELIHNAPLMRKYYYIFKSLNLSTLKDRNDHIGRTGHSRHAIMRAFIVKHLEGIKSVPELSKYLHSIPPLMEMCGFDLGDLPDETQFYRFMKNTKNSTLKAVHKTANDVLKYTDDAKRQALIEMQEMQKKSLAYIADNWAEIVEGGRDGKDEEPDFGQDGSEYGSGA